MNTKILGITIGAGVGAWLGGFVVFPAYRNRQVTITPSMVTWQPYVWTIVGGLIGAGVGMLIAKRVSTDARETRRIATGGKMSDKTVSGRKALAPKRRQTKTIKLGRSTVRVSVLSDGTYVPSITADNQAVQGFARKHQNVDKELVLLAAEMVAAREGADAITESKIKETAGHLRLPHSIYVALGKGALKKQMKMTDVDADAFVAAVHHAESEAKNL
ncbi:MAG: hypothetical protein FGM22_07395 [Burkholderiaceae bacterium]|nr:hypothetical protein [Burkholderiaceae bacterium]